MKDKRDYRVLVGNIGTVLTTAKVTEARKTFAEYVEQLPTAAGYATTRRRLRYNP